MATKTTCRLVMAVALSAMVGAVAAEANAQASQPSFRFRSQARFFNPFEFRAQTQLNQSQLNQSQLNLRVLGEPTDEAEETTGASPEVAAEEATEEVTAIEPQSASSSVTSGLTVSAPMMAGRPPFRPQVRSPFRPAPRPPFLIP